MPLHVTNAINRKFDVGDRVESAVAAPHSNCDIEIGMQGTVVRVWDRRDGICLVGVEWDRPIHGGHGCDGSAISGRGWNVYERELRLVAPESDDTDLCIDESALFSSILA